MSRRIGAFSRSVAAALAGALVVFLWRGPARVAAPVPTAGSSSTTAGVDPRSQFILLLIDPAPSTAPAAAPIDQIIADHRAWAQRLRAEGRLVAAEKLTDDAGRALAPPGATPWASPGVPGERVGGFYIIRARDYDEASRIARDGPALKYGERVQVQMIDGT